MNAAYAAGRHTAHAAQSKAAGTSVTAVVPEPRRRRDAHLLVLACGPTVVAVLIQREPPVYPGDRRRHAATARPPRLPSPFAAFGVPLDVEAR